MPIYGNRTKWVCPSPKIANLIGNVNEYGINIYIYNQPIDWGVPYQTSNERRSLGPSTIVQPVIGLASPVAGPRLILGTPVISKWKISMEII